MIVTSAGSSRPAVGPWGILSGPIGRLTIGLTGVGVGLLAVGATQASPGFSYLSDSTIGEVVGLAAGWGLVAVGLETLRRGRRLKFGSLLVAAGIAWFLPEWSDPAIGAPVAFTLGLAFGWVYPAVVGHAMFAMGGPSRPRRLDRVVVIAGYFLFIGLGLAPAIAFHPQAVGCGFCPTNLLETTASPALVDGLSRTTAILAVGWTAIAASVLGLRLVRSRPIIRRILAPILVPGIGFLVFVAIALGHTILVAVPPTDAADHFLRLGQATALVALAIGVASEWIRARRSRGRVARVVADLAVSPPTGGLRDHLATMLRDQELLLAYPIGGGWTVDSGGRPVHVGRRPGRRTTPIVRDGMVVAVIEHDPDVLRDSSEVDEVVAAARLGLEHERLQAEARAQLGALRAARRRIVAAGDARRKQLERDLHDGAQQHLIALSIALGFVEQRPEVERLIDAAASEVRLALDDLREIAHGIYPSVLGDEGFAAAVDALAERSTVPITITELVDERFDGAIEVAAYHAVADLVRGDGGPIRVRAWRHGDLLTVETVVRQITDVVAEEVADRVGTVDGSVVVTREGSSAMSLTAEIPCGS